VSKQQDMLMTNKVTLKSTTMVPFDAAYIAHVNYSLFMIPFVFEGVLNA